MVRPTATATIVAMDPARICVRVAKALHRWRSLGRPPASASAPLAEDEAPPSMPGGAGDSEEGRRARSPPASQVLAAAIVEDAEADPELDDVEVHRLREDLRRELDRLSSAEIKASRNATPHGSE